MALIPQVVDLGARPSLRTGRVDRPDAGRLAESQAIAQAAEAFANIATEQRQRDDALQVAEGKAELLTGDMALRRKLEEDGDWENFDENYRRGTAEIRDRVVPTIRTAHDQAYFNADADLTVERGALAMGEVGRRMEIDHHRTVYRGALQKLSNDVLEAEPGTRNDIFRTGQDLTDAMVEKGNMTEEEGFAFLQDFVQTTATRGLEAMDAAERLAVINGALAQVGRDPAAVLADKKAAGTGTIADFLDRATLEALKETAENEDKVSTDRANARTAFEAIYDENLSETEMRRALTAYGKENNLTAEALDYAETQIAEELGAKARSEAGVRSENNRQNTEFIRGGGSKRDIPLENLEGLTPADEAALDLMEKRRIMGEQYGPASIVTSPQDAPLLERAPSWETWHSFVKAGRANDAPIYDAPWLMAFDEAGHAALRSLHRAATAPGDVEAPPQTALQSFQSVAFSEPYGPSDNPIVPATGRNDNENELYNRALTRYMMNVAAEEAQKKRALTQAEQTEIAKHTLLHEVYLYRGRGEAAGTAGSKVRRSVELTAEEFAQSFTFTPQEIKSAVLDADLNDGIEGQNWSDKLDGLAGGEPGSLSFQPTDADRSHAYAEVIRSIQLGIDLPTDRELIEIMRSGRRAR